MKHLIALPGLVLTLHVSSALAQATPPALPALTPQQADAVKARLDTYRSVTDARVTRGEITADEAARLLQWREWQMATQAAGGERATAPADVPADYREPRPPDYYVVEPAPAYGGYYRYPAPHPYYRGPMPYAFWGPTVCAGGFGRHFGGRICF